MTRHRMRLVEQLLQEGSGDFLVEAETPALAARFLLGAADGLGEETRDRADMRISFGRATWPHLMARAMLAEQLWRAASILAGHPYHREG